MSTCIQLGSANTAQRNQKKSPSVILDLTIENAEKIIADLAKPLLSTKPFVRPKQADIDCFISSANLVLKSAKLSQVSKILLSVNNTDKKPVLELFADNSSQVATIRFAANSQELKSDLKSHTEPNQFTHLSPEERFKLISLISSYERSPAKPVKGVEGKPTIETIDPKIARRLALALGFDEEEANTADVQVTRGRAPYYSLTNYKLLVQTKEGEKEENLEVIRSDIRPKNSPQSDSIFRIQHPQFVIESIEVIELNKKGGKKQ